MAVQYICDRCGKKIYPFLNKLTIEEKTIRFDEKETEETEIIFPLVPKRFHICEGCREELIKWLKGVGFDPDRIKTNDER